MEKTKGIKALWERYKYAAIILLVGTALLLWPSGKQEMAQAAVATASSSAETLQQTQQGLQDILGTISGVGQVRVMLTVEKDGEQQLAQNAELRYSGETSAPEDYSRVSEVLVLDGDSREETVVTSRSYPVYRGALVVCEGGDRADVCLAVTEAVAVLTALPSDRIAVAKWQ